MVHCFSINGCNLVYDVNSQALHQVDDLTLALVQGERPEALALRYSRQEISEAQEEIDGLVQRGLLHARDPYGTYKPIQSCVKALCLNVAHACNLACRYCFAGQGSYGGEAEIMSTATACRGIDFLLANCNGRQHLEVDFFGGEPLLNMDTVKETVAYARKRGAEAGKVFAFTITTNCMLLDDAVTDYVLANEINMVLSLDGRPEVHDRLRVTRRGEGSYATVLANIKRFMERWEKWEDPKGYAYVRGTYTRYNLDFASDFEHYASQGFRYVSLEPVTADLDEPYAIQESDIEQIREEYRRLAEMYVRYMESGDRVHYFHYEMDLEGGPCLPKLLSGCGAGTDYMAVAPDGGLYPCHQFVGQDEMCIGNVYTGLTDHGRETAAAFRHAHVYNKEACRSCWAKFLCSGGCHAAAYAAHKSLLQPCEIACEIMRARLECALYVKAREHALT